MSKILPLTFCLLLFHLYSYSQNDVTAQNHVDSLKIHYDSAINTLFGSIKQFGADEHKKNITEYNEGTIVRKQDELIEEIRSLTLEAKTYLESGLDTTGLNTELYKN